MATKYCHLKVTCAICISLAPTSHVATPKLKEAEKRGLIMENQNICKHCHDSSTLKFFYFDVCSEITTFSPLSHDKGNLIKKHNIKQVELKLIWSK